MIFVVVQFIDEHDIWALNLNNFCDLTGLLTLRIKEIFDQLSRLPAI